MEIDEIGEIAATYQKHGWLFRRILVPAHLKNEFSKHQRAIFDNVKIIDSNIFAAWFSRPPKTGAIAWEIRFLGETQIALLETIDETDEKFEEILHNVEARLRENLARRKSA